MTIKHLLNCLFALALFCPHVIRSHYVLVISLYAEKYEKRQKEYLQCLKKNTEHTLIKKIHIVYDTSKQAQSDIFFNTIAEIASTSSKITISLIDHRQTYGDLFKIANMNYKEDDIIIANADIYFNNTLHLLDDVPIDNKIIALTRWEPDKNNNLSPMKNSKGTPVWGSQDVWIFKSPMKYFPGWAIPLGLHMCDNKIAFQMLLAGFEVVNPCLDLESIHVHKSGVRHWRVKRNKTNAYSAIIPWCKVDDIKKRPYDHWVLS